VRWVRAQQVKVVRAFYEGLHRDAVLSLEVDEAADFEVPQGRPNHFCGHEELRGKRVGFGLDVVHAHRCRMQHQVPELVRERQPYPVGRRGVIEQDYRVIADPLDKPSTRRVPKSLRAGARSREARFNGGACVHPSPCRPELAQHV